MSQVITNAFEQYWQSSLAAEQPVVLDEFILADIPNLDITAPIDPDTVLPPESQIVHRQSVDQRGRINNNAVAYTIVMDTTVGDFSFNAMYLRNKQNGVIGMIVYKGRETKLKTDQTTGQTGNSLVKSMLMGYDQAAEATLTHVDAGTWQIDYAARLRGMDEDIRQLQADLYGHHTFVGDGFKVLEKDGSYQVSKGVAIIGGLRIELKAPEVIYPGSKPIGVWVDVHRSGSLLSEHQNHFTIITSVSDLIDHVDSNGYQHYVAKLAAVLADRSVVDCRGITSSSDDSIAKSISILEQTDVMLAITSREAMRRSLAKDGYNLRPEPESFCNGGVLNDPFDSLLDTKTGRAYSSVGPYPHTVDAGTSPSDGGFVDQSENTTVYKGTYANIRSYKGGATRINCACRSNVFDGAFGTFTLDLNDTTTEDNDGTVLVDELNRRWKRAHNGEFLVAWFGASPSVGKEENKRGIQSAMDARSAAGGGKLRFSVPGTYVSGSLVPKAGIEIDLGGSTLFLADNEEKPMFFDGGTPKTTKARKFHVYNGTLDCNMMKNNANNASGGAIWLTDWRDIYFDVLVTRTYRNAFNFWGCEQIKGDQWRFIDCGMSGKYAAANYSYGVTFEPTCRDIDIGSIYIENMFGFGVHFNQSINFRLGGLTCKNVARGGANAIAITTTKAKRGWVGVIDADGVDGDNIEINSTEDMRVDVIRVNAAGNRPLIFGDNNTGVSNHRVSIGSITTTNTAGPSSIAFNYMQHCRIENGDIDKDITTMANITSDYIELNNLRIRQNMSEMIPFYPRFVARNVIYNDFTLSLVDKFHCSIEPTILEPGLARISVPNAGVIYINLNKMPDRDRPVAGKLTVISAFSGSFSQATWQEVPFLFYNDTISLGAVLKVDGSTARQIAVTADPANKRLVLTNATGVGLDVGYRLDFM